MLTEYIERAMSKAKDKKLEDGTYCGTIRPCLGAIAFGRTLRECKQEIRSVARWTPCKHDEFTRKWRKLGFHS